MTILMSGCVSVRYVSDSNKKNGGKKVIDSTQVYENFIEGDSKEFEEYMSKEAVSGNVKGNRLDYIAKKIGFIFSSMYYILEQFLGSICLVFFLIGGSMYLVFIHKNKKLQKRGLWIGIGFPVLFLIVVYGKPLLDGLRG